MPTQKITQFNGGMGTDPRDQNFAYAQYIKHFDIWSKPNSLIPYRTALDVNGNIGTNLVRSFVYGSNNRLLGLGVTDSTDNFPQIFNKEDITSTASWGTYSSVGSTYAIRTYDCFVEYNDYLYGWNTNGVFRFGTLSSGLTMTEGFQAVSNKDAAQGLVHSQDDILYLPYKDSSNVWQIATVDGTTFGSATALSGGIPTNLKIVRLVEYGAFIAIVCAPINTNTTQSRILIWDRDTSVTTLTSNLSLGDTAAKTAGVVDGTLIVVSLQTLTAGSAAALIVHSYAGGVPQVEKIVELDTQITDIRGGQVVGNKFYFAMDDTSSSEAGKYAGVWCIGRRDSSQPFSIAIARNVSTAAVVAKYVYGFLIWNDICVAAMTTSGTNEVSISNSSTFGTIGSTYRSQILTDSDSSTDKMLSGVSTGTAPMPSAGVAVLKYKKDEETSYTQIFTDSTNDLISRQATQVEGVGNLPGFNEISFELYSTGGAEFVNLKAKYKVLPEPYE